MKNTITYLGHASFALYLNQKKILIDPFLTGNPQCPSDISPSTIPADYILITHAHEDHIGDTLQIAQRTNATIVCVPEITRWLREQIEIDPEHNIENMQIGGAIKTEFGKIKMTPALHGSILPDGSYGGLACGFHLTIGSINIYFAGDTGLFSEMQFLAPHNIDYAFLPIGDRYTMGPEDALIATKLIQPKTVIPIHVNTWPLINQNVASWKSQVESATNSKVRLVKPGDTIIVE